MKTILLIILLHVIVALSSCSEQVKQLSHEPIKVHVIANYYPDYFDFSSTDSIFYYEDAIIVKHYINGIFKSEEWL